MAVRKSPESGTLTAFGKKGKEGDRLSAAAAAAACSSASLQDSRAIYLILWSVVYAMKKELDRDALGIFAKKIREELKEKQNKIRKKKPMEDRLEKKL